MQEPKAIASLSIILMDNGLVRIEKNPEDMNIVELAGLLDILKRILGPRISKALERTPEKPGDPAHTLLKQIETMNAKMAKLVNNTDKVQTT